MNKKEDGRVEEGHPVNREKKQETQKRPKKALGDKVRIKKKTSARRLRDRKIGSTDPRETTPPSG